MAAKFRMESLRQKTSQQEEQEKRAEAEKTISLFKHLDLPGHMQDQVLGEIEKDSDEWKDFLHKNQQELESPRRNELPVTALIIGISFIAGAMLTLIPFILEPTSKAAFNITLPVSLGLLAIVGIVKSKVNRESLFWGAARLVLLGAAITGSAYLIAGIFS
jgi:predicted membrane protein (TIGR00267 family)